MDDTLSAADAGRLARHGRALQRLGLLTRAHYVLLDCLLWEGRAPGRAQVRISYSILQKRARQARSTVAAGLAALERLGLVRRTRHRVLAVAQNGGRVWKQLTSSYRLIARAAAREFDRWTDSKPQEFTQVVEAVPSRAVKAAQEALKRISEARAAQLAGLWATRRLGL